MYFNKSCFKHKYDKHKEKKMVSRWIFKYYYFKYYKQNKVLNEQFS